ncbi:MAG: extracellular solute-binding protein [Treponema sp.]|nr:extracellular solute-binding protein [Treponema sp.]
MRIFKFRASGDSLLFALALAVLLIAAGSFLYRWATQPVIVDIVFTQWWQEDIGEDVLLELIAEFESLHEGIRVTLNTNSYEDMRLALFNPPVPDDEYEERELIGDVLALDTLWVRGLLDKGMIENEQAPFLSFIYVLYYNIEILTRAGLTMPPGTRSEFLTFARAVAASGGAAPVYALGMGLGASETGSRGIHGDVYPWIWAARAHLLSDGNPLVTSAPVVSALSFLASLYGEGLIAPGAFYTDSRGKLEDFVSGRTAFMVAPSRYIATVRVLMGDGVFDITSVPVPDNQMGMPFFASAGWTVGVHSESAHREEAGLFASFLAENSAVISANAEGVLPSAPTLVPFYSKMWEIALAADSATDFSGVTVERELEKIFREELSALFAGELSPAGAAAAIQERWAGALMRGAPHLPY